MKKHSIFFALSLFILSQSALAAKISQVKNNKVIIELEGEAATPNSEFFVINPAGKKVAIVKITQVKGGRALANILKGTAKPGYTMQARGSAGAAAAASRGSGAATTGDSYYDKKLSQRSHSGNSWGLVGGYLMNSMTVVTSSINASLSGSGFGALGFYDYALSPSLVLRGMGGFETYNVAGTNTAASPGNNCVADCNVKLPYLSMYGYGRWNFLQGNYKSWLGAGVGYLYPMSPQSTVFAKSQLGANQVFIFSAGMDVRMNAKTYLPVSFEYGLYPTTATVKAHIIYLRLGYAWNL